MANNKAKNQQVNQPAQQPVEQLPPNAVALLDNTVGVRLQPGRIYAIKDPVKYADDPQLILTEDIFVSAVPEGFYTVRAVGARHYVPIEYQVTQDTDAEDLTGFAPNFNVPEPAQDNPNRRRLKRSFAGRDNPLFASRAQTLRDSNQVVSNHITNGMKQGPTDSGHVEPDTPPSSLVNPPKAPGDQSATVPPVETL